MTDNGSRNGSRWDFGDDLELHFDGSDALTLAALAETDAALDRLARGLATADDDPAAWALADLVKVIDLEQARRDDSVLISRIVDLGFTDSLGPLPQDRPEGDVASLVLLRPDRPSPRIPARHARGLGAGVRTLRLAPLSGVAAAAVVVITGALFITQDPVVTTTGATTLNGQGILQDQFGRELGRVTSDQVQSWLTQARVAADQGQITMATKLVQQASRALNFLPSVERKKLEVKIATTAQDIGVAVPAEVVLPGIVDPGSPVLPNTGIPGIVSTPVLTPPPDPGTTAPPEVTQEPTQSPTEEPTQSPTEEPTESPTESPTQSPTESPTQSPTEEPTASPTEEPTAEATQADDASDNPAVDGVVDSGVPEPADGTAQEPVAL